MAPGTGFMEDNFFHRRQGDGSGSNVRDGERWGASDEALLACPLLTSYCATRFLTGQGLVLVHGPDIGDPRFTQSVLRFERMKLYLQKFMSLN